MRIFILVVKNVGKGIRDILLKPENLNLDEYKNLLLNKLKDSLEIAGFNIADLKQELIEPNTISHVTMPFREVTGSMTAYASFVSGVNQVVKKKVIQQSQQLCPKAVDFQHVHPFVKLAGGKSQLLPELDKLIPRQFNRYFEPFLGGGAMYFHLTSKNMISICLSFRYKWGINYYKAIKFDIKGVIELLQKIEYEYKKYPPYSKQQKEYYNGLRDAWNKRKQLSSDVEIAAGFIALNKAGYNGLYRVNRKGEFNVPPGEYKNHLSTIAVT